MALVPAKCTECGASIEVDETKEAGVCSHCGTAFITEKAINNYNVVNNVTNNIQTAIFKNGDDVEDLYNRFKALIKVGDKNIQPLVKQMYEKFPDSGLTYVCRAYDNVSYHNHDSLDDPYFCEIFKREQRRGTFVSFNFEENRKQIEEVEKLSDKELLDKNSKLFLYKFDSFIYQNEFKEIEKDINFALQFSNEQNAKEINDMIEEIRQRIDIIKRYNVLVRRLNRLKYKRRKAKKVKKALILTAIIAGVVIVVAIGVVIGLKSAKII